MVATPPPRSVPAGALLALSAAATWGLQAVMAKDVFAAVPPARLAQLRAGSTAVLLLAGLAVFSRGWLAAVHSAMVPLAVFGACLALVNVSYYLALARLPVGVAVSIQYTAPLLVLVARRRQATPLLWAAGGVAVAGAALVAGVTGGVALPVTGLALAVLSAVGFAGYLLSGEAVSRRLGSVASVAMGFAVASVIWAVILPWWSFPVSRLGQPGVPWRLVVVCIGGTLVPFLLMVRALRLISAGPAGVLATAEPAFAALFAWAILGEGLGAFQLVGLVLVIGGVSLTQVSSMTSTSVDPALEVAE